MKYMKKAKKTIIIVLCLILILEAGVFAGKISDYLKKKFITNQYVYVPESNNYVKKKVLCLLLMPKVLFPILIKIY